MPSKKYAFHDGKSGAALAIRVTPRSSSNQVDEILNNGTIRVRLSASGNDREINQALIAFLGDVLEVPTSKIEIVAGETGRDKLISILDMDVVSVHQQILEHLK
jgi:uncharacterized protein YggU (UPF0235/DUF167 family)